MNNLLLQEHSDLRGAIKSTAFLRVKVDSSGPLRYFSINGHTISRITYQQRQLQGRPQQKEQRQTAGVLYAVSWWLTLNVQSSPVVGVGPDPLFDGSGPNQHSPPTPHPYRCSKTYWNGVRGSVLEIIYNSSRKGKCAKNPKDRFWGQH